MTTKCNKRFYHPTFAMARTKARRAALQALYQWHIGKQPIIEIEVWFLTEQDLRGVDLDYFRELLHRIPACVEELDRFIVPLSDWIENYIDPVEWTVLRVGTYELLHHPEIPYRVIIDESVELVKRYGAEEGYRFINGMIDRLAHQLRQSEIKRKVLPSNL